MRTETLDYLLAIDKFGSLSRAAEHLFVSQPNLSHAVKLLEEELHCELLVRTNRGVTFTEKGRQVLDIARNIALQKEQLHRLDHSRVPLRFRVVTTFCQYAANAFYSLVQESQGEADFTFSLANCNIDAVLDAVYRDHAELGVLIHSRSETKGLEDYATLHQLRFTHIKPMLFHVNLRLGHPLLQKPFSPEKLWEYPCAQYLPDRLPAYDNLEERHIINPRRVISLGNQTMRSQTVAHTDAFSIGIVQPQKDMQALGLVGIPLPGHSAFISTVTRKALPQSHLLRRYLTLLEQELAEP